jgi:hypothetical protein
VSARRSIVLALAAALAAAVASAIPYGVRAGLMTLALLLAVGAPALAIAHVARSRRRRLGSPR